MEKIAEKIRELKELERLSDDLKNEIEAIKDDIKSNLGDTEEVTIDIYKIRYKPVTTNRLDTAAIKKYHKDIAERYTKVTTTRPLYISA